MSPFWSGVMMICLGWLVLGVFAAWVFGLIIQIRDSDETDDCGSAPATGGAVPPRLGDHVPGANGRIRTALAAGVVKIPSGRELIADMQRYRFKD